MKSHYLLLDYECAWEIHAKPRWWSTLLFWNTHLLISNKFTIVTVHLMQLVRIQTVTTWCWHAGILFAFRFIQSAIMDTKLQNQTAWCSPRWTSKHNLAGSCRAKTGNVRHQVLWDNNFFLFFIKKITNFSLSFF